MTEHVAREPQTPATTPPESVYLEVNRGQLLDIIDAYNLQLPREAWTYPTVALRAEVRQLLNPEGQDQQKKKEQFNASVPEGSVVFYQESGSFGSEEAVVLDRSAVKLLLVGLHLTEREGRLSGVASANFILDRIQAVMADLGAKRPSATNATIAFQLGSLTVLAMKARDHRKPVAWG